MRHFLGLLLFCIANITTTAQEKSPVKFNYEYQRKNDTLVWLTVKSKLEPGFLLFSTLPNKADDPFVSSIALDSALAKYRLAANGQVEMGTLSQISIADVPGKFRVLSDSILIRIPIKLNATDSLTLKGNLAWLGKKGDEFPTGEESFEVEILPENKGVGISDALPNVTKSNASMGWPLFFICFITGLLAVFTPCVFPLIPVTVSFFLKKSKTRAQGIRNAWWYSFSIILIYSVPTLIFTFIFGDKFIYQVSTHPVSNLLFFIIFLVFAISFFGAFEIGLPASWANRSDSVSQRGGFLGLFFMALTLVIVSFSCTGPIVAGLLSETSGKGVSMGPFIGMLGFGFGLAIPFGLFALFPSLLKSLPRSGGWLNTVKVFFGFIELALGMKFLSNADLVFHWGLLSRDVFLSIWIVLFLLLGLYLLGKLKFSHDTDVPFISIPKLFVAIASFSFALYMIPGLWGAPLKPLSGILPPPSTQAFNLYDLQFTTTSGINHTSVNDAPKPVKYIDKFHVPFGLTAYFDLEEGLAAAKKTNKPLMVDFTGWSCANCRKMENEVWSHPEVLKRLKNDFILVSLFVDDRTELPKAEQKIKENGEKIRTIGDKNLEYEIQAFNLNAQPLYKFLDKNGKTLNEIQYGYDPDISKFINHLDAVKAAFVKQ